MSEDIALFIDFENIRYSMLNIQRREPDPQELIAVARRYGTVMVARAYADWSRQPEPFKGSLMAAMIDRVDCPAKQRDRIRMGTIHYASGNSPTSALGAQGYVSEQGPYTRPWPTSMSGNSGSLPAINPQAVNNDWPSDPDALPLNDPDDSLLASDEQPTEENYQVSDYQQRESYRQSLPYGHHPTGPLGQNNTGPLGYASQHTGTTGHMAAVNTSGNSTIVQSTVVQSTVDLNMLMDIIETVFDRPTISTFVLMTGDKDFTRISARLKLRLNKTVIVVGIPGTVSRDLISSASQFVPLVPGGSGVSGNTGALPVANGTITQMSPTGNTGSMPAINYQPGTAQQYPPAAYGAPPIDALDPQFLQFLDYIDRNWSWRTIIGVSNFIGDPVNPKNRFRGRLTRESARELLNTCIQQGILLVQTDPTGAEDLRLNRSHPGVEEVLKQFVR
ncbi:MAG TPA: NYN domain-containing protein [Ktedonobacteraceae bacterium]|nr:NYN domain-containing protein [Ktedonobacteraceae bacterium]HLI88475.1 NYN domain-containing protein [Ktedonobacteraceae bacterium]